MPKAIVPSPTMARRRTAFSPAQKRAQDSRNVGSGAGGVAPRGGRRVSCFHIAMVFSIIQATAAP